MKKLFMLPALFLFTASAHADNTHADNAYTDNVNVYDKHQENTASGQYVYDSAKPLSQPEPDKQPHFFKLLQIVDDDQPVITIRADMALGATINQSA